jgi:hypothetical protein
LICRLMQLNTNRSQKNRIEFQTSWLMHTYELIEVKTSTQ